MQATNDTMTALESNPQACNQDSAEKRLADLLRLNDLAAFGNTR
jgi:hypothetical protein